jgi:uncharacterized protein (DUF1330 family)
MTFLALTTGSVITEAAHAQATEPRTPAYVIANAEAVTDSALLLKYGASVGKTITAFGGRVLVGATPAVALDSSTPPKGRFVIVEFPSMQALQEWWHSPAYTAIRPFREQSTVGRIFALDGIPAPDGAPVLDVNDAVAIRRVFLADLDSLQTKLLALARAFPADKYGWRPAPGTRSVGEVFMHVATEFYYTPLGYGGSPHPMVAGAQGAKALERTASKPNVLDQLPASSAYARTALDSIAPTMLTRPVILFGRKYSIAETSCRTVDDMHEHLGQLIAYARMNGIVPPWSKKGS